MISPSVLIFSTRGDSHTEAVLRRLSSNAHPLLIDFSEFGKKYFSSFRVDNESESIWIHSADGEIFNLDSAPSVWWRRPQPFATTIENDPVASGYIAGEARHYWGSVVQWLLHKSEFINNPNKHRQIDRKTYQLASAKRAGFSIPSTCVSSSVQAIETFLLNHPKVIFKSFSGSEEFWQPTRIWRDEYRSIIRNTGACPVIFQELINATFEYRVIAIDGELFSARTDLRDSRYPYDVRIDTKLIRHPCKLDYSIQDRIKKFMDDAGLVYGAFDLQETSSGDFYFLEINPGGQFLYIDDLFGGQISAAMACALSKRSGGTPTYEEHAMQRQEDWAQPLAFSIPEKINHLS
ncbi:hypothetical protein [Azospirillum sp. TSO5]|uniref:hypothetical protein n=1 Tax=Azospirillum sp. TSO5 TaxID=716760 RepID=UPI0011B1F3F7|nr:hypothetical protein [Azospirillum sp. TSO5]